MKKLIASVVCFGLASLTVVAGSQDKKIEGRWIATGGSSSGKKIETEMAAKLMLTITLKDGKYDVRVKGEQVESGTYKLDPAQKPALIDLLVVTGDDKGKTVFGIYKIDGDALTIAVGNPGAKERPKTFEDAAGVEITHLKRSK